MLSPVTTAAPRKKRARLVTLLCAATAVSLSLTVHGSLPLLGRLIPRVSAISSLELLAYAAPELLPVDIEDRAGPAADPEPEGPAADSDLDAPSGQEEAVDEEPPAAPVPANEPAPARETQAERATEVAEAPSPEAATERPRSAKPEISKPRQHRRLLGPRLARLRERGARGGAGSEAGSQKGKGGKGGGEGGGTARAEAKKGDPEAVYACTKDGLGKKVDVRFDRPVGDWVTVMPTVLMPFDTRPSMGEYLDGVSQVVSRRRGGVDRAGPVEFALPAQVLQMNVDEPRGVRVALGHLDGRCLVGLKYTKNLFPLTLSKVPMRVVDHANRSQSALVTITLFKDASFELTLEDGSLPFTKGELANAKNISESIEQHYAAARAFKEVAGWFGVDVTKMAREARVERSKQRVPEHKQSPKKGGKVVKRGR